MYNAKYFFVANPLNPYKLSSSNKLKTKADGSVNHDLQTKTLVQLATGSCGQVHYDAAAVEALRSSSPAVGRHVDNSGGNAAFLISLPSFPRLGR
jgi:hypothetical protein